MKMGLKQTFVLYGLGLALGGWLLYQLYASILSFWDYSTTAYWEEVQEGNRQQVKLGLRFCESANKESRDAIVHEARAQVYQQITASLFPYWYGTDYDFNGTTQVPRKGRIACGYFVTTVLEQAGFQLDRVGLARAPSEQMISELIQEQHIYRFSRSSLEVFLNKAQELGEGLYLVGLDTHTGFLWHDGAELYFVHASGRAPRCVVKEKASESWSLKKSKYRVLGSLTADYLLLLRWLRQKTCPAG